jgi:tetratricopeptide (TPR) repeat protein
MMMGDARTAVLPATLPWTDRGEPGAAKRPGGASPRSARDLEILRSLARRINAKDPGANNNLGVVYYNKGMYEEAIQHFERALELDPRMQVAERNLQIAFFSTGYFDNLIRTLHARLEANADDVEARDRLAGTYLYGGDAEAAIREWRLLLHKRPRDADVYQKIARAEMKRGDLDAALNALRNAAAIQPKNARIQFHIGEVLYQRGLHADAREPLEKAVALDDTMAEAYHLLAFVYGDLGHAERAGRAAARAGQLNPGYTRVERNLSLDRYSPALYDELVGERTARPGVAEGGALAHYNMGLAFRQKALYEEAMHEFRLATERGEDAFLVQQAQAEMMLLQGAGGDAATLYAELIEQEPASPKLWNELGVASHQVGALDRAEEAYRRALELDAQYALACNNLGVVRFYRGETEDAEQAFRAALREGRAMPDVWRNLGQLFQRAGRFEEASSAYRSAVDLDPRAALAWTGLGTLMLERGAPQRAREALVRAIEVDPDLAEARYHLAFALSALGDYQGALRETRRALELNPYIPQPRFRLLIDLQFEEAGVLAPELDTAERVIAGAAIPSFEFKPESLDEVFSEPAQPERMRDAGTAAARVEDGALQASAPASIEPLSAARAALERGNFAVASSHAQKAASLGANRIEVLLLQGEIFLERGLAGEAVERFREARTIIETAGAARVAAAMGEDALLRALLGETRSLTQLGQLDGAVEAAERLQARAPDRRDVQIVLADVYSHAGQPARAAAALEEARARGLADLDLLTRLGQAYRDAGAGEQAENAFHAALAMSQHAHAARVALARLLVSENRAAEAAAEFRAVLHALPSYGEAAFGLTELELSRGDTRAAIHVLADLLTVDPYHLPALVRLGDILCVAGMQREAGVAYRRVLHFDPGFAEALQGLERLSPGEGASRQLAMDRR